MNRARILAALKARIEGDSGSPIDKVRLGQVPDFPNVGVDAGVLAVVTLGGGAGQDDSGGSMIEFTYDITLISNRNRDQDDEILIAADRVYGDAGVQGGEPTYGLHRHKLQVTGDSNTSVLTCLYVDEATIGTDDPDSLVAHTMSFRVLARQEP